MNLTPIQRHIQRLDPYITMAFLISYQAVLDFFLNGFLGNRLAASLCRVKDTLGNIPGTHLAVEGPNDPEFCCVAGRIDGSFAWWRLPELHFDAGEGFGLDFAEAAGMAVFVEVGQGEALGGYCGVGSAL